MKRRHVIVAIGVLSCCFGIPCSAYSAGLEDRVDEIAECLKRIDQTGGNLLVVLKAAKSNYDYADAITLINHCSVSRVRAAHLHSLADLYRMLAAPGSDEHCLRVKESCQMMAAVWGTDYRRLIQVEIEVIDKMIIRSEFRALLPVAFEVKNRLRELSALCEIELPAKR